MVVGILTSRYSAVISERCGHGEILTRTFRAAVGPKFLITS